MKHLLILRGVVLNLCLGVATYLAWNFGLIQQAIISDTTWITPTMFSVFMIGLIFTWYRIFQCSRALDGIENFSPSKEDSSDVLKAKFFSRIRPLEWMAYSLVTLGFLGTVWGFKIALSGIDPSSVGSVDAITPLIASLIEGMGIALWTTIMGIILNIALSMNIRLLEGGYDKLYVKLLK